MTPRSQEHAGLSPGRTERITAGDAVAHEDTGHHSKHGHICTPPSAPAAKTDGYLAFSFVNYAAKEAVSKRTICIRFQRLLSTCSGQGWSGQEAQLSRQLVPHHTWVNGLQPGPTTCPMEGGL